METCHVEEHYRERGQRSSSHEAEDELGGLAEASFTMSLGLEGFLVSLTRLIKNSYLLIYLSISFRACAELLYYLLSLLPGIVVVSINFVTRAKKKENSDFKLGQVELA